MHLILQQPPELGPITLPIFIVEGTTEQRHNMTCLRSHSYPGAELDPNPSIRAAHPCPWPVSASLTEALHMGTGALHWQSAGRQL